MAKPKINLVKAEDKYDHQFARQQRQFVKCEDGQERRIPHLTLAEGNEDPNAVDIRRVVHLGVKYLGWAKGSAKSTSMRCVQIKGSVILVPFHFFHGANEGDKFLLMHRQVPLAIEFNKSRMVRIDKYDWCLYHCGAVLEPRKDLCKYFISEEDIGRVNRTVVMLCNVELDGTQIYTKGNAKAVNNFEYQDDKYGMVYKQRGWHTDLATSPGDCGSILLAMNTSIPAPGKILGIHTAGRDKVSEGFAVTVTREMLAIGLGKLPYTVQGMPIPCELVPNAKPDDLKIFPEGDYCIYGVMPNKLAPAQPMKTDFIRTPFPKEEIEEIPNNRKPAHLHPFQHDGEVISPLRKALTKYGKVTTKFPQRNIEKAKAFMLNIFKNKLKSTGIKVFTEQQAIAGIPGLEFAKKMNLSSSPGWPYQVLDKQNKGKMHMFSDNNEIIHDELRKRLDERHEAAKKCERVPSLWRDCLKDELRPNEKVDAGKTRLFTIAPVDYTILCRQYFLDFAIAFYENNCKFFSAVGMDPESYDWTRMYNYLAECGTKTIAGDYGTFDGTLMPDLMEAVGDVINDWYGEEDESVKNVRRTLINEMIHTMQLVENCVYATHQGNPSGNPLTVIKNSCVGFLYLLLVFQKIYPNKTLDDFSQNIRVIIYGDDVLITVMDECREFNQLNLTKAFAEHGIEFTNETKTEFDTGEFRELKDVSFLKRGFRKDAEFGNQFWLPTISLDTLNGFFHWMRKSEDPEEQLQSNMRCALKFMSFYGRNCYNMYFQKWQRCMRAAGYEPVCITFDEQLDSFKHSVGMLESNAKLLQMYTEDGTLEAVDENKGEPMTFARFCKIAWELLKVSCGFYLAWNVIKVGEHVRNVNEERQRKFEDRQRDDRHAICIPSGEGKSTLKKKYPKIFNDHDDVILKQPPPAAVMKSEINRVMNEKIMERFGKPQEELNFWERIKVGADIGVIYESWVRKQDFPIEDRKILLTHAPNNTGRNVLGMFVTPEPTGVRNNLIGRIMLKQLGAEVLTFEERDKKIMELAREHEPQLFEDDDLRITG